MVFEENLEQILVIQKLHFAGITQEKNASKWFVKRLHTVVGRKGIYSC